MAIEESETSSMSIAQTRLIDRAMNPAISLRNQPQFCPVRWRACRAGYLRETATAQASASRAAGTE